MAPLVTERDQEMELLRGGDSGAWEVVINRYQVALSQYLYNMVKDKELARDLTQDTFLKAYQALQRINGNLNLKSWLYRIATNGAIDVIRRRRLLSWIPWREEVATSWQMANTCEATVVQRELVRHALNKIPGECRAVLLLHDNEGFGCQEIGQLLGISVVTAKRRLARARVLFREAYKKSDMPKAGKRR
jgi:RNA polymerase sigma-70 factor (ECF subfamily)